MSEEEEWQTSGEVIRPEHVEVPGIGYLAYDPNTLRISPHRDGSRPVNRPIPMTMENGKFWGTKQPHVPTCSEPGPGNMGCSKWHGCKIGQMYKHVGPGPVIMKKLGTVTMSECYDYFESTVNGRPTSQNHYGIDGYKIDTTRTTIDYLSRDWAIEAGILTPDSPREKVINTKPKVCKREIADLLPPWWPLMKKKGLPLPEAAKYYPEAAGEEKPKKAKRA